ncbi:MAG: hypothetical protein AAB558_01705 [Patescibacteria group bacterium]
MSLPRFLFFTAVGTLVCILAWLFVLFFIDPTQGGAIGPTLFFISLYLSVFGIFLLIGFFIRLIIHKQEPPFHHVAISLRQSFWLATLLVLSLILQWNGLFEWWIGVLLVIGFSVLEAFFLSRAVDKRSKRRPVHHPQSHEIEHPVN